MSERPAKDAPGQARDFRPSPGWCAREVAEELPGLRLLSCDVQVARRGALTGSSPADVSVRLRELSNRLRGSGAVAMRRQPVPSAYRVFFRNIGLDPDVRRTPIEAAVLERMLRGGFLSGGKIRCHDTTPILNSSDAAIPITTQLATGRERCLTLFCC